MKQFKQPKINETVILKYGRKESPNITVAIYKGEENGKQVFCINDLTGDTIHLSKESILNIS